MPLKGFRSAVCDTIYRYTLYLSLCAKIQNGPLKPKIQKSGSNTQIVSRWVQKDIWVEGILLLEVWVKVGGGSQINYVQGKDSYPVKKCINTYMYIVCISIIKKCINTYMHIVRTRISMYNKDTSKSIIYV